MSGPFRINLAVITKKIWIGLFRGPVLLPACFISAVFLNQMFWNWNFRFFAKTRKKLKFYLPPKYFSFFHHYYPTRENSQGFYFRDVTAFWQWVQDFVRFRKKREKLKKIKKYEFGNTEWQATNEFYWEGKWLLSHNFGDLNFSPNWRPFRRVVYSNFSPCIDIARKNKKVSDSGPPWGTHCISGRILSEVLYKIISNCNGGDNLRVEFLYFTEHVNRGSGLFYKI